ncbi:MAG: tRNA (N(6)-L-threonylcarbamoyladenosine(37)-C(2))-methylthiotransferase MtaB, partial [Muribaculaceae bacterium]
IFPYSERPGTRALSIEHVVDPKTKNKRTHRMLELSTQKLTAFTERFIGTQRSVLFEQPHDGKPMHGFTDNYLKVEVNLDNDMINKVGIVTLDSFNAKDMTINAH